jgi:hypothetical protein
MRESARRHLCTWRLVSRDLGARRGVIYLIGAHLSGDAWWNQPAR